MKNRTPEVLTTETTTDDKSLCDEIVKEINLVRTNPERYLAKAQAWQKTIKPKLNTVLINDKPIVVNDIDQCYEDLINYLSFVKSMPKLLIYDALVNCADEFINTISNHPYNEENLQKNSVDFEKRVRKFGIVSGTIAELVEYGSGDAEAIVLKFLLDEKGDKTERSIIFNNNIKYIGVSSIIVNSEVTVSVLNFSESQKLRKDKLIINLNKKLVFERLGKKGDSAKDYINKMRIYNNISLTKRKYSQSISTNSSTSLIKNIMTTSPVNTNSFRFRDILKQENSASGSLNKVNIPVNPNKSSKAKGGNDSLNSSLSNLKDIKISTDTLDKAPNLLKRLMSPNPQQELSFKMNAKVVNINLVDTDSTKERKREDNSTNTSRGSGLSSPIRTIRGGQEPTKTKNGSGVPSSSSLKNRNSSTISDIPHPYQDDNISEKETLRNLKYYNNTETTSKNSTNQTPLKQQINNRNSNNNSILSTNSKLNYSNFTSAMNTFSKKKSDKKLETKKVKEKTVKFDDKSEFEKEIMDNGNIVCINVNKKKVSDSHGKDYFLVKKTVYYANGSTDEWVFKE